MILSSVYAELQHSNFKLMSKLNRLKELYKRIQCIPTWIIIDIK